MDIARQIAANSPVAVMGSKLMLNYARDHSVADSLDYVATWQAGMFQPETDLMAAFVAKSQKLDADYKELQPTKSKFKN